MEDISVSHQHSKKETYWDDLVAGNTSQYKEILVEKLISAHLPGKLASLIDIGCGTCETVFKYHKLLNAQSVTCIDYNSEIVASMKEKHADMEVNWLVEDIIDLSLSQDYDLVFLLDMIHEIYSFYGRPNRDQNLPIDHAHGQDFVRKALTNVAGLVRSGGGIILTDNMLSPENNIVSLRCRTEKVKHALEELQKTYPSRKFTFELNENGLFSLSSHDLCILLTQYNKLKSGDHDRFAVERLEIHQYMTLQEYDDLFSSLGFQIYTETGTPKSTLTEWNEDFEIISGLTEFPDKRITLLAVRT
ncbi:MAG: class I SAM-dependent methyltransferase [SAR324 cluster bacterium]|nr:class I SAM-dependent methyltransferase [SAR324 cluster bacterium]